MAEAPDKSLEGLFKDYQTRRNLELRRGFSRAMAGRSGDPNIMKIVAERTRDLSPADRAEMKTETLKSLKELESLRTRGFTEGGAKNIALLDNVQGLERALITAKGGLQTEKLKSLAADKARLEKQLVGSTYISEEDYEAYVGGGSASAAKFSTLVDDVVEAWGANADTDGALLDPLYDALMDPAVGATRTNAFLRAIEDRSGLSREHLQATLREIKTKPEKVQEINRAITDGLKVGEIHEREAVDAKEDIVRLQAEINATWVRVSPEAAALSKQVYGAYNKILRGEGDPAELKRLESILGIGPGKYAEPRDMTAEEQRIHDELMDTLDYLEKGTPESRELREAIFKDPRFIAWMDAQGYSNPEQAFKVWLKEAKTSARRSGARTRRQHLVNVAAGATAGGPLKFAAGTAISSREERAEALKRSWGEGSIFKDAPTRSVWEVRRAEALREGMREPAPVSRTEILDPVETERTKRRKARTAKLEERAGVRREEKRKAEVAAEDAERAAARKAAEEAASDSLTAGEGRTKPRSKRRF